jgi:hypothetical protein
MATRTFSVFRTSLLITIVSSVSWGVGCLASKSAVATDQPTSKAGKDQCTHPNSWDGTEPMPPSWWCYGKGEDEPCLACNDKRVFSERIPSCGDFKISEGPVYRKEPQECCYLAKQVSWCGGRALVVDGVSQTSPLQTTRAWSSWV